MYIKILLLFIAHVSLCFSVGATSQKNDKSAEDLMVSLIKYGDINCNQAELIWLNCRIELIHAKEAVEDLEFYVQVDKSKGNREIYSNGRLSTKEEAQKIVNILHPLVKHTILDCLKKKNLMFLISREETLASHSRSPSSPKSSKSPTHANPPVQPFFPRKLSDTASFKHLKNSTLRPSRKLSQESSSSPVVPAAVALVIVAMLIICFLKICGSGSPENDERPLLSLSLSDHSLASSQKSFYLDSSLSNIDSGSISFDKSDDKMDFNLFMEPQTLNDSGMEIPVGNDSTAATLIDISGPVATGPSGIAGMPPLKPPPGRIVLPPPPTAGPPVPPPLLRPSSGGPHPPAPGPPPPPPPPPSGGKAGPCPPPRAPGGPAPPGPAPMGFRPPRAPSGLNYEDDGPKTKLKPFFWDKVLANEDSSMVWHQIKAGSFQFNEEMIETLFGAAQDKNKSGSKKDAADATPQYIQIIEQKKAQNLSILLKALNVTTEEVCDALKEGNELPAELVQTLLKMAPTADEELKLRLYNGDLLQLGFAERFLKALVEIPFAYKRLESLHFMCTLQEEVSMVKESFATLEAACAKLRKSRLFLKLLEAVLKTGNRMNSGTYRGGAQAFKLDTLLKLSDVKGKDGKTTLLHFVVMEIIRLEGLRSARASRELRSMSSIKSDDLLLESPQDSEEYILNLGLEVVSALGSELEHVKRAALIDADNLTGTVARLGHGVVNTKNFLKSELGSIDEDDGFRDTLENFMQGAEGEVMELLEQEKQIMALVRSTGDYFHGNAGKDEGLRLFTIVRDFMMMLDKVCTEIRATQLKTNKVAKKENPPVSATPEPLQSPQPNPPVSTTPEPVQSSQPNPPVSAPPESVQSSQPNPPVSAPPESIQFPQPNPPVSAPTGPVQSPQPKPPISAPPEPVQSPQPSPHQKLHPAIAERRVDDSSSSSSCSDDGE